MVWFCDISVKLELWPAIEKSFTFYNVRKKCEKHLLISYSYRFLWLYWRFFHFLWLLHVLHKVIEAGRNIKRKITNIILSKSPFNMFGIYQHKFLHVLYWESYFGETFQFHAYQVSIIYA